MFKIHHCRNVGLKWFWEVYTKRGGSSAVTTFAVDLHFFTRWGRGVNWKNYGNPCFNIIINNAVSVFILHFVLYTL